MMNKYRGQQRLIIMISHLESNLVGQIDSKITSGVYLNALQ